MGNICQHLRDEYRKEYEPKYRAQHRNLRKKKEEEDRRIKQKEEERQRDIYDAVLQSGAQSDVRKAELQKKKEEVQEPVNEIRPSVFPTPLPSSVENNGTSVPYTAPTGYRPPSQRITESTPNSAPP